MEEEGEGRDKKEEEDEGRRAQEEELFFFFQAEDGIRDIGVTGVQTCALPIWPGVSWAGGNSRCSPAGLPPWPTMRRSTACLRSASWRCRASCPAPARFRAR